MTQVRAAVRGRAPALLEALGQVGLVVVFGYFSLDKLTYLVRHPEAFGATGRLYLRAAEAWLNHQDPWAIVVLGDRFAAPPPTLLVFAPLTPIGEDLAVAVLLCVGFVSALFVVRRLGLPSWWLLFPPLFESTVQGSPDGTMFALLLLGGLPAGLAPVIKIYGAVPLVLNRQWRAIGVTLAILAASIPILPWGTFFADRDSIVQILEVQSKGTSAWGEPILVVIALASLVLLGRRRAAWSAVAGLWPYAQRHYSLMTIAARPPVIVSMILSTEIPGSAGAALGVWVAWNWIRARVFRPGPGHDDRGPVEPVPRP